MFEHLQAAGTPAAIACGDDPIGSLTQMFVGMVQQGRIAKGQCPALRPVFLKPHGVAHGVFAMREDVPQELRVGLFAGTRYPLWARFSSDTVPTSGDFKTTLGVALKLFDTPTPKIFGQAEDRTFDFLFQNMDVFFVDTARDMCEFTKAGVVDGDYAGYLDRHPVTKAILDEMAKPVGSCLATSYWSGLPFALGLERYVKYRLEPVIKDEPPSAAPVDPAYLAADLAARMRESGAEFRFMLQLRTDPETMPLDAATVRWPESRSPYVHVADVSFPPQDVTERGQVAYGENLSFNIWRVTDDHRPAGSVADARRAVYAASAETRRNVNGIPDGEPAQPRPGRDASPCVDSVIVRAAIHPGIGIARVGDAAEEFFIGPEVTEPAPLTQDFRDASGALKRQAARFRIYGYNAAGQVVRELTAANASIAWTVHVASRKADWFQFITAMDIAEASDLTLSRRNAALKGADRAQLVIDPGPRSIAGASQSGGADHAFDTGRFKKERVYLGELQTDAAGRLIFLGGRGRSESPGGKPPFDPDDPDSFNNADDWFDDISDGPVDATVSIDGRAVPVEGAWVITAPPNYATDIVDWRTLHDLLADVYVGNGWLPVPEVTSFDRDVLPQLWRLSNLQWVNKGFQTMFGRGGPMDFNDPEFLARLNQRAESLANDPYAELRRQIVNLFRPNEPLVNEPRVWPWLYGDDFGGELFAPSPRTMLALPALQQLHLQRWAAGTFTADWDPQAKPPASLDQVPLAEQPAMLDKAALHFCLADAFHPGCEVTWPVRHASLYQAPFRIRRRPAGTTEPDYGATLDQKEALSPGGPLHGQGPGDISRWMGLPWQGDTAYCRAGYDPGFDLYLPSFWPARVPNNVLTQEDYAIVMDPARPREERIAAYMRRASWYRLIDQAPDIPQRMMRMVADFGRQGIVEPMPGIADDPVIPEVIYVETLAPDTHKLLKAAGLAAAPAPEAPADPLAHTVWGDAEHLRAGRALRARRRHGR